MSTPTYGSGDAGRAGPPGQHPYGYAGPAPYGQSGQGSQMWAPPAQHRPGTSGMAITSLVVGVLALLLSWVPIVNNFAALLALVGLGFGIAGLVVTRGRRRGGRGLAIAGTVVSVLALVVVFATQALFGAVLDDLEQEFSGTSVSGTSSGEGTDAQPVNEADEADGPAPDDVFPFGEEVVFDDGSTLVVSPPQALVRDEFAFGGEDFPAHVQFELTFTNNTDEVFDPTFTTGGVTSGGVEGDSVFQDGLDAPDNPVLPGQSITWSMGYGVQDPADVTLDVNLGFLEYDDVIFSTMS